MVAPKIGIANLESFITQVAEENDKAEPEAN